MTTPREWKKRSQVSTGPADVPATLKLGRGGVACAGCTSGRCPGCSSPSLATLAEYFPSTELAWWCNMGHSGPVPGHDVTGDVCCCRLCDSSRPGDGWRMVGGRGMTNDRMATLVMMPTGSDNALPIASSGCLLRFPLRLSRVRQAPLPRRPDSAASGVAPLQARRSILCYRSGWVWLASGRARRRGNLGHSYETQLELGRKTAGPSHDGRKVARVSRARLPRGPGGGPTVGVCVWSIALGARGWAWGRASLLAS